MPPRTRCGAAQRAQRAQLDDDRPWWRLRCCGCSLEVCCIVQAYLVMMSTLLFIPISIMEYFRPIQLCQALENSLEGALQCELETSQARAADVIIKVLLQTIAFFSAASCLVGISRKRPKLMLPYIRVLGVQLMYNALVLLVKIFVFDIMWRELLIVLPLRFGLPYYMWLHAYSLYGKMKREQAALQPVPSPPESPTGRHETDPVRLYGRPARPPGLVVPVGYGLAPPPPAAPAPPAPPAPKPGEESPPPPYDDSPPPPYNAVVVCKPGATDPGGAPPPV